MDDEKKIRTFTLFAVALVLLAAICAILAGKPAHSVGTAVPITLTHHDAHGHTQQTTANFNSLTWSRDFVQIEFTSDQLYCSAFGGQ